MLTPVFVLPQSPWDAKMCCFVRSGLAADMMVSVCKKQTINRDTDGAAYCRSNVMI